MQAVWLEDGRLSIRDVPTPVPADGETLVRVLRTGICNTDLEMVRGYRSYEGIVGHEFVGVAEAPSPLAGRRVVGEINVGCGTCPTCARGDRNHCDHRVVMGIHDRHGAFAEYVALPADNLHVVPDTVSTDAAVFVEPLAAALEVHEQVAICPSDRVLVVGDGKLGQLVARTLSLTGCELLVAGHHPNKLEHLAGAGIRTTNTEVGRGQFDAAIECTGNADGVAVALGALRPRGILVMKSTYQGSLQLDAAAIVVNEITVIGSRCGPFAKALDLLARGTVDIAPLVHARYRLGEAAAAFERAEAPGVLKVLIDVS